jgi:hypothetical protein
VWFTFEYAISQQPAIEKILVIQCKNDDCSAYVVEDAIWEWMFQCADNWCRWDYYPSFSDDPYNWMDPNPPDFRLKILFSDIERVSNVTGPLPASYGDVVAFKVTVNENDLLLVPDTTIPKPGMPSSGMTFLLTLLLEPLVMAGVLTIWIKPKLSTGFKFWGLALLINLISYPMLWSFFTSIAKYHTKSSENLGYTLLALGILFPFLIVVAINMQSKGWKIAWIISSIAISIVCSYLCLLGNAFGSLNKSFVLEGLSFQNAILLIELSAVAYEGLLFYGLNRRKIPFLAAMTGSLAMNLVSFLVGLFFYNPWA